MKQLLALLLAVSLLAVPSAALAQSAGDEQYEDPFGEVQDPDGTQGDPAPAPDEAPAPATPAETPAAPAEQAVTAQDTAAPTLPATGLPAFLLASAGSILLAGGAALRRRVS
jgi:hypothetical protein